MRLIFEEDIEGEDFLELILSPTEYKKLYLYGVSQDYTQSINSCRPLNVYFRVDLTMEEECPLNPKPNKGTYSLNFLKSLKSSQNIRQKRHTKSFQSTRNKKNPPEKAVNDDLLTT